jgi:hypothetical protein
MLAPKSKPVDTRDYAPDSIQAESMRQAEQCRINEALAALRQALQAGSARQAELRQAELGTAGAMR